MNELDDSILFITGLNYIAVLLQLVGLHNNVIFKFIILPEFVKNVKVYRKRIHIK